MSSVIVVKHGFRRAVIAAGMRGAPGLGGGSAGVSSFNTRTGPVMLVSADVSGALGYTPANSASLAGVALSGAYADLSGLPAIPAAPGDVGAATAAQGAKADTAVQPADLSGGLAGKVDKDGTKVLSDQNYTAAEKAKLAGIEGAQFKGLHISLVALQAAHPTAAAGNYADVDSGTGADVARYIWDVSDSAWIIQSGATGSMTAAQIKTAYESNPDTNAFSDAEQAKLGAIAAGATANADTDSLSEGSSNLYHTAARVRAAVLTGFSLASAAAVSATDNVLSAIGKLQKQISDLTTVVEGKQAALVSGTNIKAINGQSLLGAGNLTVSAEPAAVVAEVTTARVAAIGDASKFITFDNEGASTYTIEPQSAVAWVVGTEIHVYRNAAGNLTLTPGSAVTLKAPSGGSLVLTNAMVVTLKLLASNSWAVIGQTVPA